MRHIPILLLTAALSLLACNALEPEVVPNDDNYPFRLLLDEDEGADLPDAEDYGVEITFADYLGELPTQEFELTYEIKDASGSFVGAVEIDEVLYTVEIDDCEYERELSFTSSSILVAVDPELGTVPEAFEVVLTLPGLDDTEGGFVFEVTGISGIANVLLNETMVFEYEVLENDLAGEWVATLDAATLTALQDIFGPVSYDLTQLDLSETAGELVVEFDFAEMKLEIELLSEEEVCEEGDTEMEAEVLEVEAEYGAEAGEFELEGSYWVTEDDGTEVEELDFIYDGTYTLDGDQLTLTFLTGIGEDNFETGDELYSNSISLVLQRD
jgi:hypothetical protein